MSYTAQNILDEAYGLADLIPTQIDPGGSPYTVALRKLNLKLREVQEMTGAVEPAATTGLGGLVDVPLVNGTREYDLDTLITASLGAGRPYYGVHSVYFFPQGSTAPSTLSRVSTDAETTYINPSAHPVAYYLAPVSGIAGGTTRIGILPTPDATAALGDMKIRLEHYVQVTAVGDQIYLHDALFEPLRLLVAAEFALTSQNMESYGLLRAQAERAVKSAMGLAREQRDPIGMNPRVRYGRSGRTPFPYGKRGYPGEA